MPLPNPGMSFTPFDILTAAEMNELVDNIEALQDGSAFDSNSIDGDILQDASVTADKLYFTTTTDSGWEGYIEAMSGKQCWRRYFTGNYTVGGNTGVAIASSITLPTGVTLGTNYVVKHLGVQQANREVSITVNAVTTTPTIWVYNPTGGTFTSQTYRVMLEIVEM